MSKQERHLCPFCLEDLPRTHYLTYSNNPVFEALRGRVNIEYAFSYLFYSKGNSVSDLIHDFKYHGVKGIGIMLSKPFADQLNVRQWFQDYDVVIPVPLHRRKRLSRGFNQSEIIAEALSLGLSIELETKVLYRIRHRKSQTQKSRFKRWQTMTDVYAIRNVDRIKGKRVLLVDDVFTTGATMEACVQVIHRGNPAAISVVTLAYTE